MGNFEKLGILVIIVLVVVILVLAVWGMGVPPNEQLVTGDALTTETNAEGVGKSVALADSPKAGEKKDRTGFWPEDRAGNDLPAREPVATTEEDPDLLRRDEPAATVEPAAKPAARTHTVVKNDSFYNLSKRYYGSAKHWGVIRDANPEVNPNRMRLGTILTIPHPDTVLLKADTRGAAAPATAKPPSGRTCTVRKGETLTELSVRVLGSSAHWRKLYDANRARIGNDPDRIAAGMVLVIP